MIQFFLIILRTQYNNHANEPVKHLDNQPEAKLISELKKGSLKAFDTIYDKYAKRLFAYSLQYTKSEEDAEEIVQDVFVRLWNSRTFLRQEETLRSLLFIMAKHHLINAYRTHVNSVTYEDYVDYQDSIAGGEDSSHALEYKEFVTILNKELHKLPITQQKVIRLSKFSQLNNREIAIELGLSEQTVKNQLSLGLKSLRNSLKNVTIWGNTLFLINNLI